MSQAARNIQARLLIKAIFAMGRDSSYSQAADRLAAMLGLAFPSKAKGEDGRIAISRAAFDLMDSSAQAAFQAEAKQDIAIGEMKN